MLDLRPASRSKPWFSYQSRSPSRSAANWSAMIVLEGLADHRARGGPLGEAAGPEIDLVDAAEGLLQRGDRAGGRR